MDRCSMHKALLVPEVLSMIFKHITDDSDRPLYPMLAAIARTCWSFHRNIVEILWYELPSILVLYNALPRHVQDQDFRMWSVTRRSLSGPDWTRFLDRASRVRVLVENASFQIGQDDKSVRCATVLLAMAALREPIVLTPNLRKLVWQTNHTTVLLSPTINLFIGPRLETLEIEAKLLIDRVITAASLADTCPKLRHLKISGNGRSAAGVISSVLCRLHRLETVACSTLDDDAFAHLARLECLSSLAVDMRWSVLHLDSVCNHLGRDSFSNVKTLHWKDYDLDALADLFLLPDIAVSSVRLEIESFCTPSSLRTFLRAFAAKFPRTRGFSLVHDVEAGKRFGLLAGVPGREHQLVGRDLEPLWTLRSLRALTLLNLGAIRVDDGLVGAVGAAFPELEQVRFGTAGTLSYVTFGGFVALLERCPRLRSVAVCVNAEDVFSFRDTPVCHGRVTHVWMDGRVLETRWAEVEAVLKRVMPGLMTVEESSDGVVWRVRDVRVKGDDGGTKDERVGRRRTRAHDR